MDENQFDSDGLLKFLKHNPLLLSNKGNKVIAHRSVIANILAMPKEVGIKNATFRFKTRKYNSHIYISQVKPDISQGKKNVIARNKILDDIFRLNCISGMI